MPSWMWTDLACLALIPLHLQEDFPFTQIMKYDAGRNVEGHRSALAICGATEMTDTSFSMVLVE